MVTVPENSAYSNYLIILPMVTVPENSAYVGHEHGEEDADGHQEHVEHQHVKDTAHNTDHHRVIPWYG